MFCFAAVGLPELQAVRAVAAAARESTAARTRTMLGTRFADSARFDIRSSSIHPLVALAAVASWSHDHTAQRNAHRDVRRRQVDLRVRRLVRGTRPLDRSAA